jgi:Zn-dependent M32 family carboxypeptidase
VHVHRNIKRAAVPEPVKKKMRSLICIEHEDFEGCLQDITREGGKVGTGKSIVILSQSITN